MPCDTRSESVFLIAGIVTSYSRYWPTSCTSSPTKAENAFVPKLDFFLVAGVEVTCSSFLRSGSLLFEGRFGRIGALAKVAPF